VFLVLGKNSTSLIFKVVLAQVQHLPKLPPDKDEGQSARTSLNPSVGAFGGTAAVGSTGLAFNVLVLSCTPPGHRAS